MSATKRFYLLDILKIMTLVAIAILHTNEFVFYEDVNPLGFKNAPAFHLILLYARFLSIGGQILVGLIFLLFGLSQKTKKDLFSISLFALIGQLVLTVVFQAFEWDIYIYLSVTTCLIALLPFFYGFHWASLILSFLVLWIPTSFIQSFAGDSWILSVLTGKMTEDYSGSWPLLPQFFLALLFYQVGLYIRSHMDDFKVMKSKEKIVWGALFLCSLPFLGVYYPVPIGPHYYDFVFNQPTYVFWANFLVFVFIMRMSFLDGVQRRLEESKFAKKISALYWNRQLGFTYLISIIYLGVGMSFKESFFKYPWAFDLFFLGLLPISEILSRLCLLVVKSKK